MAVMARSRTQRPSQCFSYYDHYGSRLSQLRQSNLTILLRMAYPFLKKHTANTIVILERRDPTVGRDWTILETTDARYDSWMLGVAIEWLSVPGNGTSWTWPVDSGTRLYCNVLYGELIWDSYIDCGDLKMHMKGPRKRQQAVLGSNPICRAFFFF